MTSLDSRKKYLNIHLDDDIELSAGKKNNLMDRSGRDGYGSMDMTSDSGKSPRYEINPILLKKLAEKQQNVLMMEIFPSGDSVYKEMSLRELLSYINKEANAIDTDFAKNNTPINSNGGNKGITRGLSSNFDSNGSGNSFLNEIYSTKKSNTGVGIIQNRDLRRLEFQFNPLGDPTILVRRHAVLVSFDPIRAVIMADRMILMVPDGADSLIHHLEKNLHGWNEMDGISFEARAYEAVLATVVLLQNQDFLDLQSLAAGVLGEFRSASIIQIERQEHMRMLKNRVNSLAAMVAAYKRSIEELLEDDNDLALMNLTRLKLKPSQYSWPLSSEILCYHEEMEVLLESYLMDFNSLLSKLDFLKSEMQSAEELVMLRLDTSRNQLLIADTVISVVACCIGLGSFIGSIYGMNLKNHMEEDEHMFTVITWLIVFGIGIIAVSVLLFFRMWGILPNESGSDMNIFGIHSHSTSKYDSPV